MKTTASEKDTMFSPSLKKRLSDQLLKAHTQYMEKYLLLVASRHSVNPELESTFVAESEYEKGYYEGLRKALEILENLIQSGKTESHCQRK